MYFISDGKNNYYRAQWARAQISRRKYSILLSKINRNLIRENTHKFACGVWLTHLSSSHCQDSFPFVEKVVYRQEKKEMITYSIFMNGLKFELYRKIWFDDSLYMRRKVLRFTFFVVVNLQVCVILSGLGKYSILMKRKTRTMIMTCFKNEEKERNSGLYHIYISDCSCVPLMPFHIPHVRSEREILPYFYDFFYFTFRRIHYDGCTYVHARIRLISCMHI